MYQKFWPFIQALEGRRIWKRIQKKYRLAEDGYLLVFTGEQKLFGCALEYLPEFLEKKYASAAVVAVLDGMHVRIPKSRQRIYIERLAARELSALLRYYRLNSFFEHVIPVSLKEPFGSYGLLQKQGIRLSDLVRDYLMV